MDNSYFADAAFIGDSRTEGLMLYSGIGEVDKYTSIGISIFKLESKKAIIKRIHEAEKYVPLDRLYLSPQCGFASCEIGNKLTEEQQWAKLRLVKEIAEEVWDKDGHIG